MKLVSVLSMSFVISTTLAGCSEWTHTYTDVIDMVKELGKGWQEESTPEKGDIFVPTGQEITVIEVDGGDLSGHREPYVAVDIGYGDREYWAYTNEYGQLVRVVADEIILQDESKEPVTEDGRYYEDEAKVQGVERADLDEGHVIADSLGGVSNAYNITPQNRDLNRHGKQAYMEKVIRDAGGCTNFEAVITYPNTDTQIPSHYSFTYTIDGNVVKDEFENSMGDKSSYRNSLENGNSYYSLDSVEYTEIKGWKSYVNDFVFLMYIIVELILIITALLVAYNTYVNFKRRFRDREK